MNVKDYEYVIEIAETGSISKAADRLFITQGALTKFLQRLEKELGNPIFYRAGNQFLLTPLGKIYIAKGKEILRLDRELSNEISNIIATGAMPIRFGYPASMGPFVMEQLLPEYYRSKRDVRLSLFFDSSKNLIRRVEDSNLDICLAYADIHNPGLEYICLGKLEVLLAVPINSRLNELAVKQDGVTYPVLNNDSWLEEPYISLAANTYSGHCAKEYFEKIQRQPNVRLYVDNTRSALMAVENGLGNCILARVPYTDRRVHYLGLPYMERAFREVCIVVRKFGYRSEEQNALIKLLKKIFPQK